MIRDSWVLIEQMDTERAPFQPSMVTSLSPTTNCTAMALLPNLVLALAISGAALVLATLVHVNLLVRVCAQRAEECKCQYREC